ncbi:hypothetical protein MMC18_001159 [Xylographa bjoerkii]|nr:hypothetical protein [Xylographa bjoerkii]
MAIKSFYLLGEAESNSHEVEVDITLGDLDVLRANIANHFAIVEPSGVAFQNKANESLDELHDILETTDPIAISVDGHSVREAPGPKGLPVVGTYYEVYPDHIGNHQRMFETYGPVIETIDMGRKVYLTNDPAIAAIAFAESEFFTKRINDDHPLHGIKMPAAGIFIGDTDSEAWRVAHKFFPPALSPKAVRHYTPMMQKTVESTYPVFDELDGRGEAWNVYQYMLKLGSATIGKLSLNQDFHHFDSVDAPLHRIVAAYGEALVLNKKVTARGDWYGHLPFGDPKKLKDIEQELVGTLEQAIKECKRAGTEDLPINDAALSASCIIDYAIRAVDPQGNKLPHENLLLGIGVITGAGFVTTASLLSWLVYSLVAYPGMQDRLLQELVDNGINGETEWNYDNTNALPFLDKFIKETQRLHNPSFQPGRTAKEDLILPGGYRMPVDAVIIMALHHVHNNPTVWDNPHKFDPDRWDTEKVKKRHKCAYIPFGFGQRGCIGFNFALQEVKVLIPSLLYRYEFSNAGEDPVEYDPFYQLVRPVNFYVRAKKRTEWPEPTPKLVSKSNLGTTPEPVRESKLESTTEPTAELATGPGKEILVDTPATPVEEPRVGLAIQSEKGVTSATPTVAVRNERVPTVVTNGAF